MLERSEARPAGPGGVNLPICRVIGYNKQPKPRSLQASKRVENVQYSIKYSNVTSTYDALFILIIESINFISLDAAELY